MPECPLLDPEALFKKAVTKGHKAEQFKLYS